MIQLIRYEFFKLFRLKKFFLSIAGINFVPLLLLFVFSVLIIKGLLYGWVGIVEKLEHEMVGNGVLVAVTALLATFSWFAWFFQTIIAGELISKEFENKSIKLMLLMPFSRLTIYFGKLATTIIFFILNMVLYLSLLALLGVLMQKVFFLDVLSLVDYSILFKLCCAFFVVNFSCIALVFLVSLFARSAETSFALYIFLTVILKSIDGVVLLFGKLAIIQPDIADFMVKYSYLKSCEIIKFEKISKFIERGNFSELPITFDMLGVNMLYSLLFLYIGYIVFKNKEEKG